MSLKINIKGAVSGWFLVYAFLCLCLAFIFQPVIVEIYFDPDERIHSDFTNYLLTFLSVLFIGTAVCFIVMSFLKKPGRKLKARLQNLSVSILAVFITFALLEVLCRLFFPFPRTAYFGHLQADEVMGWVGRPNIERKFSLRDTPVHFSTGDSGFRKNSSAEGRKIAFFGDSFTMAIEVPSDSTFVNRFESKLRQDGISADCLNYGLTGYGPQQYLLTFREMIGKVNLSDVYMVVYAGNDFNDLSSEIEPFYVFERPAAKVSEYGLSIPPVSYKGRSSMRLWYSKWLPEIQFLNYFKFRISPFSEREIRTTSILPENSLPVFGKILQYFDRECEERGIRFHVLLIPSWPFVGKGMQENDHQEIHRFFSAYSRKLKFHYLNSTPLLKRSITRNTGPYFSENFHLNELGHKLIAELLYEEMGEDQKPLRENSYGSSE